MAKGKGKSRGGKKSSEDMEHMMPGMPPKGTKMPMKPKRKGH